MQIALSRRDPRTAALLGCGLLATICFGLLAGRWPIVALGGAAALALAVVMISDLAIGIAVFTVVSFAEVASSGSASAAKGVGILLVLAWLIWCAGRSGRVRSLLKDERALVACAAGLVAWSLLSAAWAQSSHTALGGASRYAQDLMLLPILYMGISRLRHVRLVIAAFVVGAIGATAYGALTGSSVDGSRLVGALGDPNETASTLVAAAVLALGLGVSERSPRRRAIAYAASAVALLGAAATASRGGVVALGVAGVVAVALAGEWRGRVAAAFALVATLVVGWFALLAPASSRSHITSVQSGRTTLWALAGRAISSNPVVGLGNDNFSLASKDYLLAPGVTNDALQVVIDPKGVHNIYLEVWADLGVVGLLLFVGFSVLSLRAAWRAVTVLHSVGRRSDEMLARALIVATVAILASDLFQSDQYSKQRFLLAALAPAMLAVVRRERDARSVRS